MYSKKAGGHDAVPQVVSSGKPSLIPSSLCVVSLTEFLAIMRKFQIVIILMHLSLHILICLISRPCIFYFLSLPTQVMHDWPVTEEHW